MKHIIIEGVDRLGKDTLINGIWQHYNKENFIFRHFGKPPKGMSPQETLDYQFNIFNNEIWLVENFIENMDEWSYYPNNFIWNRSHLGEYVYAQMFRGISRQEIRKKIQLYEERCFTNATPDMYLITLAATPEFCFQCDDGDSLSNSIDNKTKELELFKEVHKISIIPHKKTIKVDFDGEYRSKESILESAIKFINEEE